METQNNKSRNSSATNSLNLSIGFVISLLLVISAFEWKTYVSPGEVIEVTAAPDEFKGIEVIEMPIPKPVSKVPKAPEPVIDIPPTVEVVDDGQIIEDIKPQFEIEEFIEPDISSFVPKTEEAEVAPFVERAAVMPEFNYKNMTFSKYIGKNLRLTSKSAGITGTVFVRFIIDHDGSVTEVEVLKGLGEEIDKEALRVVKNSPKWIPASQGGRTVRLRMVLPIRVSL